MTATNTTRRFPIIRATCTQCGLRLVGEVRFDGKLYATRHPELVEGEPQPTVCIHCAEASK